MAKSLRFLSLFSGIEAASVAWKPLGWKCVGVAEIEPFPCAVLKHHYPDVPNLGSVTDITDEQIAALGPIDLVVGGSPCQDLSVAGKRAGLAGERSGLFHDQLRIFNAARHLCGARFLLWENVPGAFPSNRGRDFAVVAGEMAGCRLPVPEDGWGTEGVALGEHGLVEWAVLDAQWFGVAQRRRRVFALLDTGDWSSRPPILLEPDSLRGDSAPSREAREVAPTIPSRRTGGGGLGTDFDCDGGLIARPHADVSPALKARDSKGPSSDGDGDGDGAILVPMVAHSLRGEGFDGSEDGTGRGTPLVPVAFAQNQRDEVRELAVAGALAAEPGAKQQKYIAFSAKDYGADAGEIAPTLRSMGHDGSHANGGGQVAVAFMADDYKDGGYEEAETARPLTTSADRTRAAPIALSVSLRGREGGGTAELGDEVQNCLRASGGGGDKAHVLAAMQVRRLTPVECARLQGFPEVEKSVTIFVCSSDLQKNSALAEIRNHRSQERAYSVAANQSLPSARPAGRDSSICLLGHDWPVALHVQIDCVQRQVRISSRGRLLWSASSAAQANSSRLPMPVEDFVRLAAHTMGCLVPTMQSGRVDATEGSTSRVSGHEFAVLSTSEIAGNASDAERLKSATSTFMTSITSPVQQSSPSYEQTLQTWSCFVAAAIASYIPEQIRSGSSFALSVEAITPYLQVPWRGKTPPPDGPMYKALGNSMATPVMAWIGRQIEMAVT